MDIQVDASRVIKAQQEELATLSNRLMLATAVNAQLMDERVQLQERIREAEAEIIELRGEVDAVA